MKAGAPRRPVATLMYSFAFLLQSSTGTNPVLSFLPLIFIVAIFYFLVFMPMQRQKKQQAQMLSNLEAGAEVLTTGGIVGTIISISGDTLILRVKPDNIKLQIARSAVSGLVKQEPKPVGLEKK
ncbi:MAG TPA: preprotein translocase subunit YajC [Bryobacteraceae bacterium]